MSQPVSTVEKNNKKVINAWCSYDIANSAYNLIITTALFPLYYQITTKQKFGNDIVTFLGIPVKNTVLYDYAIAAAYFLIIFLTPLLSGIADLGGYRKRFMRVFTMIGGASCFSLYWFNGANIEYGIILVGLAVIGYAGSLVYYNSFLPIIATPDRQDKVSARGFSFGYAGSMLLLIINLLTITFYNKLGFKNELDAMRFSFLEVGIWWIAISQIAFWYLKEYSGQFTFRTSVFSKGFIEIIAVFKKVSQRASTIRFLLAFWFFSMGVQTIMLVATQFGLVELKIPSSNMIYTILIIQVLAIVGATLFGEVSARWGNKLSLMIMLCIWIAVCISAYGIKTAGEFYILAGMVGMVMGGIQSQARSTYSKLIPKDTIDTASYFSFYDITEKLAIVLGMFSFGLIEQLTGSMRNSALTLSGFFIVSLVILAFTRLKEKA
ncbi:MAG: MFS transporter [Bacteroidota bacterium]|nr:MFS transporter [Bacteroidota bacterium]